MNTPSVVKSAPKRRRFTPDFKSSIVTDCMQSGVSVSRIALDNRKRPAKSPCAPVSPFERVAVSRAERFSCITLSTQTITG